MEGVFSAFEDTSNCSPASRRRHGETGHKDDGLAIRSSGLFFQGHDFDASKPLVIIDSENQGFIWNNSTLLKVRSSHQDWYRDCYHTVLNEAKSGSEKGVTPTKDATRMDAGKREENLEWNSEFDLVDRKVRVQETPGIHEGQRAGRSLDSLSVAREMEVHCEKGETGMLT